MRPKVAHAADPAAYSAGEKAWVSVQKQAFVRVQHLPWESFPTLICFLDQAKVCLSSPRKDESSLRITISERRTVDVKPSGLLPLAGRVAGRARGLQSGPLFKVQFSFKSSLQNRSQRKSTALQCNYSQSRLCSRAWPQSLAAIPTSATGLPGAADFVPRILLYSASFAEAPEQLLG